MNQSPNGSRAWFVSLVSDFDKGSALRKLGSLASGAAQRGVDVTGNPQFAAWQKQLDYLEVELRELTKAEPSAGCWTVLLEYEIPRRQRRIDAVLLSDQVVFVLEFKMGEQKFKRADLWQAEDYALDLRDFHKATDGRTVVPILVATRAGTSTPFEDGTLAVHRVGAVGLAECIMRVQAGEGDRSPLPRIEPEAWDRAAYSPTPTIVEATQRLFAQHSVAGLSHSYADNLDETVAAIRDACVSARAHDERLVCFVTGVPGAGKTLAGLAAVHAGASDSIAGLGAYLSGNGPLVRVLREAIARDAVKPGTTKREAMHRARALIQNVHEFVEEYGVNRTDLHPAEHLIVFDEAQRAWHKQKLERRHADIGASEPGLMLAAMSRLPKWCGLVALVGGGQEIHSGEAGLSEWGRALGASDHYWRVLASPEVLRGGDSVAFHRLFENQIPANVTVTESPAMHLSVSVRSPRARYLAEWVNAILALDIDKARDAVGEVDGFRLGLTRSLSAARAWLRDAARTEHRAGLLASSGSLRHRAYGLEMTPEFLSAYPIEHWFLGSRKDIRSSHSLEVAMSEFKCQGLEIDFVGLGWGGDLTLDKTKSAWDMRAFKGSRWLQIKAEESQGFLLNKYRVLLTRAREGMVVWVPRGDHSDPTREPERMDRTAELLLASGLPSID